MANKNDHSMLVTVKDLETANMLRSHLCSNTARLWLYVMKNSVGEYDIAASNEWGGYLSGGMIELLTNECNVFLKAHGKLPNVETSAVEETNAANDACEVQCTT